VYLFDIVEGGAAEKAGWKKAMWSSDAGYAG